MKKYLKEVESRIVRHKPKSFTWDMTDYIGAGVSKYRYLNVKIPNVRAEFKKGFSFSSFDSKTQWKIYDYIWKNSEIFEASIMASYWVGSRPIEELYENRKTLLSWVEHVDNWAHSDELSSHLAKLVEYNFKLIFPTFKKWNQSNDPWKKRQSMVGLLYYSRLRTKHVSLKVLLQFVDRHIDDKHYYVQKGVGWTLRETWNVYPVETYDYLKKIAHRIPTGGWTAATEKLSLKHKKELLNLRKRGKRNG